MLRAETGSETIDDVEAFVWVSQEPPSGGVPVTLQRLQECESSARFWIWALPRYADRNQKKADNWAILAGTLTGITGLAIWPVLSDGSVLWQQATLSSVALLSVLCNLVPRVKNYAEEAASAREVCSQYGSIIGLLTDLSALARDGRLDEKYQHSAHAAVGLFERAKAKKDLLRGLPDRWVVEARRPSHRDGQVESGGGRASGR